MGLSKRVDDAERELDDGEHKVELRWPDDPRPWPAPEGVNRWRDEQGNWWIVMTWGDDTNEEAGP